MSSHRVTVLVVLLLAGRVHAAPPPGALTVRPRPTPPAAAALKAGGEVRTGTGERRRAVLPDGSIVYLNADTTARLNGPRLLTLQRGEIYVEAAGADPFTVEAAGKTLLGTSAHFAVRLEPKGPTVGVTRGQVQVKDRMAPIVAGQQLALGTAQAIPMARASHSLAWIRDAMTAAEAPLLPANDFAGGALVAIDPNGQEAKLTLRNFRIDVHVEDGFARTTIDQTYFNHHGDQLEGTFYFPLPPDASLSRLAMYVNGQLMEGGMAERDHARNVYETIRYARRDPALLEWVDGSTFKMRVFPLEPRQEKRIVLSYSQRLPALYGKLSYRFPAGHTLQKVRDWSLIVRVKGGANWTWECPSHPIQARNEKKDLVLTSSQANAVVNRDVVLTIANPHQTDPTEDIVQFATAEHEGARYLLTRYRPSLATKFTSRRRDWVFLVETSGDRDPLLARVQIEVLRHLLSHAEPDDTFAVLAANTRVTPFNKEPLPANPENVGAAIAFLESAHLIGALDLGQALTEATGYLAKVPAPHLVHLGSGIAAMGERRDDVLAKRLPDGAAYVGVGIGRRWNRSLMKLAAERTGGHFTQINPDEPLAWRAFELVATINTPRLMDVEIRDQAGKATFLAFNQAIAQGEEIVAITRALGKGELPKAVVVKATLAGKAFERVLPVKGAMPNAGYLPRTWAKLEIDRLLAADPVKHKEAIVVLSKGMYVMTPFTSLLVLENEDQYTQFKVDRGRKDHWALYPLPERIPVVVEPDPELPGLDAKAKRHPAKQVLATIARIAPANGVIVTGVTIAGSSIAPRNASETLQVERLLDISAGRPLWPTPAPLSNALVGQFKIGGGLNSNNGLVGSVVLNEQVFSFQEQLHSPGALPPATVKMVASGGFASVGYSDRLRQELNQSENLIQLQRPILHQRSQIAGFFPRAQFAHLEPHATVPLTGTFYGRSGATREYAEATKAVTLSRFQTQKKAFDRNLYDSFLTTVSEVVSMPAVPAYTRPPLTPTAEVFHDLIRYAPGLHTSAADILGVLDAEALPAKWNVPGKVESAARTLLNTAVFGSWRSWTIAIRPGDPVTTIQFDGAGRFTWSEQPRVGLRERVVCDGKTLLHAYPQLALAARRDATRFHRAELAAIVPWYIPLADELARGADVRMVGERTVAIVPHRARDKKDAAYHVVHLIFVPTGELAERRVILMPKGEIVTRMTLTADGTATVFDGKGKELVKLVGKLVACPPPNLTADAKGMVALPLPYRTSDHVRKTQKLEKKTRNDLTLKEALPLFAAYIGEGKAAEANQLFQQVFHAREQRQLGFYVLLAARGVNLDSDHGNVLAEHFDSPLAQYLALHTSPVLRKHASQWAAASVAWQDPFLQHLAGTHALLQRWQEANVLKGDATRVQSEKRRAIDYVRKNGGSRFAWALLCLMQDRADKDAAFHGELADLWPLFEKSPALSYAARYEQARSLWKAGKKDDARRRFRTLYEATIDAGFLPAIDGDLHQALLADDVWSTLLRQTARRLVKDGQRCAVLAIARQSWDLGDQPLAGELANAALDGIADPAERAALTLAVFDFLRGTAQFAEAERLLNGLLADNQLARHSLLWRLGHALAIQRDMPARAIECLEKALALEAEQPPEVIDLQATRTDYGALLEHYQGLADAMVALKLTPPPDYLSRVIRAADRWRAVDNDATTACQAAAKVLRRLGERELAWDYLTTPVALHPAESTPWSNLAGTLCQSGELDLADRAYRAASEAEPTDPQLLWDRAQNLKHLGKQQEAQRLIRRIAEGTWQPRFQGLQAQARHALVAE